MDGILPDDVWLEIVEQCRESDESSLSLVNNRLRRLALPMLYRTIYIGSPCDLPEDHQENVMLANLIRVFQRIRFFHNSPHLLRHVRVLTLGSWSTFSLEWPTDDDQSSDAEQLHFVIYDLVIDLLSKIPRLRSLQLRDSHMTPRLYQLLHGSLFLDTFEMSAYDGAFGGSIPVPLMTSPLPIRHISYHVENSLSSDQWLSHILAHSILDLHSLSIDGKTLDVLLASISNRSLSLQELDISLLDFDDEATFRPHFLQLLQFCSGLLSLTIRQLHGMELHFLDLVSPDLLPNLEIITAPMGFVQVFAPGRPLKRVAATRLILGTGISLTAIIGKFSTAHLRELNFHVPADSNQTIILFLHRLRTFKVLTNLELLSPFTEDGFSEIQGNQVLRDALINALSHCPQLRVFRIPKAWITREDGSVALPIALERNPSTRGHPSLEVFKLDHDYIKSSGWIWVHKEGWIYK